MLRIALFVLLFVIGTHAVTPAAEQPLNRLGGLYHFSFLTRPSLHISFGISCISVTTPKWFWDDIHGSGQEGEEE